MASQNILNKETKMLNVGFSHPQLSNIDYFRGLSNIEFSDNSSEYLTVKDINYKSIIIALTFLDTGEIFLPYLHKDILADIEYLGVPLLESSIEKLPIHHLISYNVVTLDDVIKNYIRENLNKLVFTYYTNFNKFMETGNTDYILDESYYGSQFALNQGVKYGFIHLFSVYPKYAYYLEFMLQQPGVDVNLKANNKSKASALHIAVKYNNIDIINMLLRYSNIDINSLNVFHMTPLVMAIKESQIECVKILIKEENIDVNSKDGDGNTPFMICDMYSTASMRSLLLQHPKINISDA